MKLKRLELIQLVRALAIIFVLLGHLNLLFSSQFNYDWFDLSEWGKTGGVDIFFVISGFMITYLYSKNIGQSGKAYQFLKKRILKIIPMYWVVTIGSAMIYFILPQMDNDNNLTLKNLFTSLFFVNEQPILGVAWSLSHVILFYIGFTLLIKFPKATKFLLGVWATIILLRLLEINPFSNLNQLWFGIENLEIWSGALIAFALQKYKVKKPLILVFLGILTFLVVWVNNIYNVVIFPSDSIRPALYCFGAILLITGVAGFELTRQIKMPKLLNLIGDSSYTIFLIHAPFLKFYILIFSKLGVISLIGLDLSMILITTSIVITSIVIHKIFETPLNRLITTIFLKDRKGRENTKEVII